VSQTGRKGKPATESGGGHALAGGGPSQLGVDGSMRARDVSRPTEADLDTAAEKVRISRRNPPPATDSTAG
jgi:hypothetical protein